MRFAKQQLALLAVSLALSLNGATPAAAHGGEDHDAPPPPVSRAVAPRASATSDEFEVVTVLINNKLVVYVDRYGSNEPVAGAQLEVEGAGLKGAAAETAPGIYTIAAAGLPAAAHPLTISIETADSADLLTITLDTSDPSTPEMQGHAWGERVVWLVVALLVALLVIASGVLLAHRRRQETPK